MVLPFWFIKKIHQSKTEEKRRIKNIVSKLWERNWKLPQFPFHDYWYFYYEKSGSRHIISCMVTTNYDKRKIAMACNPSIIIMMLMGMELHFRFPFLLNNKHDLSLSLAIIRIHPVAFLHFHFHIEEVHVAIANQTWKKFLNYHINFNLFYLIFH